MGRSREDASGHRRGAERRGRRRDWARSERALHGLRVPRAQHRGVVPRPLGADGAVQQRPIRGERQRAPNQAAGRGHPRRIRMQRVQRCRQDRLLVGGRKSL